MSKTIGKTMNFFDADFDVSLALQNDASKKNLQNMQDKVNEIKDSLQKKVAKGLKKDEFEHAQNLLSACDTANYCLDKAWNKLQK